MLKLSLFLGEKGPKNEAYQFQLIPDGQTMTDIDLGQLGGARKAVAELKGNSIVTNLHKLDNNVVDVIATRIVDPQNPNKMIYKLKDVPTGYELVQVLKKQ